MAEPFLGEIRMFGFNFAPRAWAFCNNQLLPINQNSALFSLLGTIYGGDGRTTFALPNLQGRVPVHFGNGAGLENISIGQTGGSNMTTLNTGNMPSHNHTATVRAQAGLGGTTNPDGQMLGAGAPVYEPFDANGLKNLNAQAVTVSQTGNNIAFSTMQPFQGVNFCIALQGLFPSRS